MKVNEIGYEGSPPIDSYGGGGFRLSETFHKGGLLLTPDGVAPWSEALSEEGFAVPLALAKEIDVLLVGMGAEIAPLPRALREVLEGASIGVEVMSTASACRTYNVLLAENRRIAAALIAV
jgi:uncharacterized protein